MLDFSDYFFLSESIKRKKIVFKNCTFLFKNPKLTTTVFTSFSIDFHDTPFLHRSVSFK